jgi:hypothetical protein
LHSELRFKKERHAQQLDQRTRWEARSIGALGANLNVTHDEKNKVESELESASTRKAAK